MIARNFFTQSPVDSARGLIGCELVWGGCSGLVVESEAYAEQDDPACHTFSRPSARAFVAAHEAGAAYVYFNYGMHWMLNVLVKGESNGFVLLRAIEPRRGLSAMVRRRGGRSGRELTASPGRLAAALGVTGRDHGRDFCTSPRRCFLPGTGVAVVADGRIGISRAQDLPWRFCLPDSPFLSVRPKPKKEPSRG